MATTDQQAALPAASKSATDGILDSIAVLKDILRLDSPSKRAVDVRHTSLLQQRFQEQQASMQKIRELQNDVEELTQTLAGTRQECDNERALRKQLQAGFDALVEHRKKLETQLDVITASRDALQNRVAGLDDEIKTVMDDSEARIAELETKLHSAVHDKDRISQKLGATEAQLSTAERKVSELERSRSTLLEQVERLKKDQNDMVQQQQETEAFWKQKLKDADQQHEATKRELEQTRDDLEQSQKTVPASTAAVQEPSSADSDAASSEKRIATLQQQLQEMTDRYNKAISDMDRMQHTVTTESAAAMFDEIVEEKNAELSKIKAQLEEALESYTELAHRVKQSEPKQDVVDRKVEHRQQPDDSEVGNDGQPDTKKQKV